MSFGAGFLAMPDLFPARQSGEPWGPERVVIHFAGNDYVCDGLTAIQAGGIRRKFGTLCTGSSGGSRPAVEIRIFRAATESGISISISTTPGIPSASPAFT